MLQDTFVPHTNQVLDVLFIGLWGLLVSKGQVTNAPSHLDDLFGISGTRSSAPIEIELPKKRGEGFDILTPRRAHDDPAALVERFRRAEGGGILLGARTFWQGVDIPGDALQAVVIAGGSLDVCVEGFHNGIKGFVSVEYTNPITGLTDSIEGFLVFVNPGNVPKTSGVVATSIG